MAILHRAEISPSKLEMVRTWVRRQPWAGDADPDVAEIVGAYRFDDPAGEVGIEVHLVRAGDDAVLQVPLTYRAAEHPDAAAGFVTTMEHSVLGRRWVYDGCADAVCVTALVTAAMTGGREAKQEFADGTPRESPTKVSGSGEPGVAVPSIATLDVSTEGATTTVDAGSVRLLVVRRVGATLDGRWSLRGTWPGHDEPALLAAVR